MTTNNMFMIVMICFILIETSKQSQVCIRSRRWCTHRGSKYELKDCDEDGILDPTCRDNRGNFGVLQSSAKCSDTWPRGSCKVKSKDFELIAEKKSCRDRHTFEGLKLNVHDCARSCQDSSSVFYFPRPSEGHTDEFTAYRRCHAVGCPCYCVVGASPSGECNMDLTDAPRYNVYRFKPVEYTEWSSWSSCDRQTKSLLGKVMRFCGAGESYRTRTCMGGGYDCNKDKQNFGQVKSCKITTNCVNPDILGGSTGGILTTKLNCRNVPTQHCELYAFPGFSAYVCWEVEKKVCL